MVVRNVVDTPRASGGGVPVEPPRTWNRCFDTSQIASSAAVRLAPYGKLGG